MVLSVDNPWFPHSWTAWGILVVGAACAAAPSYYAACIALLSYVCFDACGTPAQIATWAGTASLLILSPFVAIRVYQTQRPTAAPVRLVFAGLFPALALAALAWFFW